MGVVVYQTDVFEFNMDVVMHSANTKNIMGAGIAKTIKNKYREAFIADKNFNVPVGNKERLGKFSWAWVDNNKFRIFNIYSQHTMGIPFVRHTQYDAVESALIGIMEMLSKEDNFRNLRIGIPYGFGSVLGGGDWSIVRDIFERVSDEYGVTIYACKLDK